MNGRASNSAGRQDSFSQLEECVLAFASAVKNLTIYPSTHPRVTARADEVARKFNACHLDHCELTVAGEQLLVEGKPLTSDHLAVLWLVRRCREAGLRGIAVERGCSADDVIRFAAAVVACRPGAGRNLGATWSHESARVRPLELLVEENYSPESKRQPGELPPAPGTTPALRALGVGCAELLTEIAERPTVKELLRQIEASTDGEQEASSSIDLLGMIGELLPADLPRDPEQLAATVEHILTRVHGELGELLRHQTRVKGAELLRSAVGVARSYFTRQAPKVIQRDSLPTGRPGDEQYGADLQALLVEFEALPKAGKLLLPTATRSGLDSPALARELLGVYLFGLAADDKEQHRRVRIELVTELVSKHKAEVTDLLDAYLSSEAGLAVLPGAVRVQLLGSLANAGLTTLLRARGFLDQDLVTSCFPEVMRFAPILFVRDEDLPMLRSALVSLNTVLNNGGAEAAAKGGHLDQPATIGLLTKIASREALLLLSMVESNDFAVNQQLCEFARNLMLPPAEATLLKHYRADDIPPPYIRRLLRAAAKQRFEVSLRDATGELIGDYLLRRRAKLPAASGLALVSALQHVPGQATEQLLRQLCRAGRFVNFTRTARLMRQQARASLAALQKKTPA